MPYEIDPRAIPPEVRAKTEGPDWYKRMARPLTRGLTETLSEIEPERLKRFRYELPLGLGTLSGKPEDIATTVVPQTKLDAALVGVGLLLPEIKGLSIAEKLPIVRRLLQTRTGRTAIMAAAGAVEQSLEGKSPWEGAKAGATVGGVGELVSAGTERLLAGPEAARYTSRVGKAIRDHFPWIRNAIGDNPLHTGADFDAAFKGGKTMQGMVDMLNTVKRTVASKTVGRIMPITRSLRALVRDNPEEWADVVKGKPLTFRNIDKFISTVRRKAYLMRSGEARDAAFAARIRMNADAYLKELEEDLNKANPQVPGLGTAYRNAQQRFWEAKNVSDLFSEPNPSVIEEGHVQPGRLQKYARESGPRGYRPELEGTVSGKRLLSEIFNEGSPAETEKQRFSLPISLHPGEWLNLRPRVHPRVGFGTVRPGFPPQSIYGGLPTFAADRYLSPGEALEKEQEEVP